MIALSTAAEPTIEQLLESDDDQLLEQPGLRAQAISITPEIAGVFDTPVTFEGTDMGASDALRELGTRIYRRWEKETFAMVCGSADADKDDRSKLIVAHGQPPVTAQPVLVA